MDWNGYIDGEKQLINNNMKQQKTKALIEKLENLIKIKQKD